MVPLRELIMFGVLVATGASTFAQTAVDVAWGKIRTCQQLGSFEKKYSGNNPYSGEMRKRRNALCQVQAQPKREATVRRQAPSNRPKVVAVARIPTSSRMEVTLDVTGRGNATTLAEAWRLVKHGGVIRVMPGSYYGNITVFAVTIKGITGAGGARPIIRATSAASTLSVTSGNVTLENLEIISPANVNSAVFITGGNVTIKNSVIRAPSIPQIRSPNSGNAAIYTASREAVHIANSIIGPGNSQALAIGDGKVSILDSSLTNAGSIGIFSFGGVTKANGLRIHNVNTAINLQGSANFSLSQSMIYRYQYAKYYAVEIKDKSVFSIESTVLCIPSSSTNWIHRSTVANSSIRDTSDEAGRDLMARNTSARSDLSAFAIRFCRANSPNL